MWKNVSKRNIVQLKISWSCSLSKSSSCLILYHLTWILNAYFYLKHCSPNNKLFPSTNNHFRGVLILLDVSFERPPNIIMVVLHTPAFSKAYCRKNIDTDTAEWWFLHELTWKQSLRKLELLGKSQLVAADFWFSTSQYLFF